MIKRFATVVVCLAASGGVALAQQPAATTGSVKGTVLVNHGSGFVRVPADAPLAPGDRLMARPGGRTTIVYADGCTVNVKPGSTVTVSDTSPCKSSPTETTTVEAPPSGIPVGGIALAGLAGAGAIAGIVLLTQHNGGGTPVFPISP